MIECGYCGARVEETDDGYVPNHLDPSRPDGEDCRHSGMEWHKFVLENGGLDSDEYEIRRKVITDPTAEAIQHVADAIDRVTAIFERLLEKANAEMR